MPNDPWSELVDGPASTEGNGKDHAVPAALLEIHLACEVAGITPAAFAAVFGAK